MDVRDKIRVLLESEGVCITQVAHDLEINRNTLNSWGKNTYPRVNDLLRLANYFGKPISYFFDDYNNCNQQRIQGKQVMATMTGNLNFSDTRNDEKIKHLHSLLGEKDKIINEKERVIQLLINQIHLLERDSNRDNNQENANNQH